MADLIEGKVAQILSERHIVINVGSAAGVMTGMNFVVLAQGDDVKDPSTGALLGKWELPKGFLLVTHVQERMSTCEGRTPIASAEDASTQVLSQAMIEASMRPDIWGGNAVRLDVNRAQMRGVPRIAPISIGDTVREVKQSK